MQVRVDLLWQKTPSTWQVRTKVTARAAFGLESEKVGRVERGTVLQVEEVRKRTDKGVGHR